MTKTFYHVFAPFRTKVRDPNHFRDMLWMDSDEIEQRNQIDAKLVSFARDLEIIMEVGGKFVRKEYSQSSPQSLVLTNNYRYTLTESQIAAFFGMTGALTDLFLDLHTRLCIGYSPTLLDKLASRTYAALTIAPTEDNPNMQVDHEVYPYFWIYPYFKERMHELLSVGLPH